MQFCRHEFACIQDCGEYMQVWFITQLRLTSVLGFRASNWTFIYIQLIEIKVKVGVVNLASDRFFSLAGFFNAI